jgi:hypothetical protein
MIETLAVSAIVALALFFISRAIYRTFSGKSDSCHCGSSCTEAAGCPAREACCGGKGGEER